MWPIGLSIFNGGVVMRMRCFDSLNEATISMMLNGGLTDDEQEKVEAADRANANAMLEAGVTDRAF